MNTQVQELTQSALEKINQAKSQAEINDIKAFYIGKNSFISDQFKKLTEISPEKRSEFGKNINEAKKVIENALINQIKVLQDIKTQQSLSQKIDVTLPGRNSQTGSVHILSRVNQIIEDIFISMGFSLAKGPEIESHYYNFEALNIPEFHPARDMHDTFYLGKSHVLRTHTSPVQIRAMETTKPPLAIFAPGKVYRCDSDLTHSPMFHQVEGLLIDKGVSFADLRGVLQQFLESFFNQSKIKLRFRSSYFPFTEPSAEVDVSCVICAGQGCRTCSNTGWLEVLGSGMVHPNVLAYAGIDSNQYNGFAFGMGIERLTMLRYGIDDMRLLFENNTRFLNQFK